jgi:pimeloyl-ACP methyl ester carboxylesterase
MTDSAGQDTIDPFTIAATDAELDDLRDRLRRTRWPDPETVDDWSQGLPLSYARELCEYWAQSYDWRAREARLNEIPQYRTELDGLGIHFAHARSPHENAMPLLMTHGWPGSLVEFSRVVDALANPTAHGGSAEDAFHVVCPTLPGFGFSDKPTEPGWNVQRIARAWAELMARLGYERYGAHGGDWGSILTPYVALADPQHVAGIHLTMPIATQPEGDDVELGEREKAGLARMKEFRDRGTGYSTQQRTRPQTLGYGLADSPAGQCAWIVEKFYAWSDCGGHPENVFSRDALLDNVMLYWLPDAGASSARIYWESYGARWTDPVSTPTGVSRFPKELSLAPRHWVQRRFTDVRYWNELDRGGHFAALEQPELLVNELRECFRSL